MALADNRGAPRYEEIGRGRVSIDGQPVTEPARDVGSGPSSMPLGMQDILR